MTIISFKDVYIEILIHAHEKFSRRVEICHDEFYGIN